MKNPISALFAKDAPEGYVANRTLFAYSLALTGQNMTSVYVTSWLFYFMNNILHIDPYLVGIVTSVSRVWDSVNDPVMGALIDRHRFKSGEKLRPYLSFLPPFIGVLGILMFINFGFSPSIAIVYITVIYLLWDILFTVQETSMWGMIAMSSPHLEERARVTQWVSIGSGFGSTILTLFPMIKGDGEKAGLFGFSEQQMFLICAVVFTFGGEMMAMLAGKMKEQVRGEKPQENIFKAISDVRHNKNLIIVILARFMLSLSLTVPAIYFFESSVSYKVGSGTISGGTAMTFYTILNGIPGAFSMFFATKIAKKAGGMKKVLILAQSVSILMRVITFFVGYNTLPKMIAVIILMSIVTIPGSLVDIAQRSLTSDSIDEMEYKTGKRSEGVSFSILNFINKLGGAVALFINGAILKLLKYDSYTPKTEQNPTFMRWQWPLFILGPAVGAALYLIVISFLKDDLDKKKEIEMVLKERRERAGNQEIAVRG